MLVVRCCASLLAPHSEASSDIGDDTSCHSPLRSSDVAAAAARWLRLSAADVTAIRESIHWEASAAPQDLSSSPVRRRHTGCQEYAPVDRALGPHQAQRAGQPRSPVAFVRESIHVDSVALDAAADCNHKQAPPEEEEGSHSWVRESVHVPVCSLVAASAAEEGGRWGAESPRDAAGGGGGGWGGTMSIVERIQQLDRQKKQAVAR
jgi:hypothetical protein